MKKAINTMVESIKKSIIRDLNDVYSVKGNKVLNMLLKAYNDFQESELQSPTTATNLHVEGIAYEFGCVA